MSIEVETNNDDFEKPKKKQRVYTGLEKLPPCQYNQGVSCSLKGRVCPKCGWNPKVSELRKQAIMMGDTHFLRFTERYLEDPQKSGKSNAPV